VCVFAWRRGDGPAFFFVSSCGARFRHRSTKIALGFWFVCLFIFFFFVCVTEHKPNKTKANPFGFVGANGLSPCLQYERSRLYKSTCSIRGASRPLYATFESGSRVYKSLAMGLGESNVWAKWIAGEGVPALCQNRKKKRQTVVGMHVARALRLSAA